MAMGSNNNAIIPNTVKDELYAISLHRIKTCQRTHLSVVGREAIETFLYHMVPIEVLNQIYNSVLQGMDNGLDLVANQCTFPS